MEPRVHGVHAPKQPCASDWNEGILLANAVASAIRKDRQRHRGVLSVKPVCRTKQKGTLDQRGKCAKSKEAERDREALRMTHPLPFIRHDNCFSCLLYNSGLFVDLSLCVEALERG